MRPSCFTPHWPSKGGPGALPRWVRILWHGPYGQLLWPGCSTAWRKTSMLRKHNCKKKRWCQVFFQVCFGDFAQLDSSKHEHSPNPWFSRLQMLCGEAEKGGAWDGVACPLATPGASKISRHFEGLFPITNEFISVGKQQTKPKLWLQMMDLWEAKEGVQYNGSHPTTSKVYTDLHGSEWLLPLKASFVDAMQMKLDFQDFGDISKDTVVLFVPGVAWLIFEMIWVWSHLRTVLFFSSEHSFDVLTVLVHSQTQGS